MKERNIFKDLVSLPFMECGKLHDREIRDRGIYVVKCNFHKFRSPCLGTDLSERIIIRELGLLVLVSVVAPSLIQKLNYIRDDLGPVFLLSLVVFP